MGINRDQIVTQTLGGYAMAINGPVPPGSGATNLSPSNSSANSANSIANATTLLSSAADSQCKHEYLEEFLGRNTFNHPKNRQCSRAPSLAQAIQADWNKLDVQTNIQLYEPGDLSSQVIQPRSFQALLFGMVIGKGGDLYDFWSSKETASPGLNITSYSNPAVDKLLDELRTETNQQTHNQELSQVNQLISADYPAVFIESPDFLYSVPKDLKGVILPQITAPSDRFATVATWYRRTESVWPFLVAQTSK